jgi:ribosomal protein S18 acetylase RimI-like enzyme
LTSPASTSIGRAPAADRERTIATILAAFIADPPSRWVLRSPQEYFAHMPTFVHHFCGSAFDHETGFALQDFMGAALWLPPGIQPDEEGIGNLITEVVPEEDQDNVFAFFEEMDKYHPKEPVWYLAMIGVDPSCQSKGFGSALLSHTLETIDREGKLAYLEATTTRSRDLYARHGFETTGEIQVGDSPTMYPMLREPR